MSNEFAVSESTPLRTSTATAVSVSHKSCNNNNDIRLFGDGPVVVNSATTASDNNNCVRGRMTGGVIETNNFQNQVQKMDSKRILGKVAFDFFILLCVGFPILLFYLWGEPYKRGFFCDDESLKYPFHESTVKNWMLYLMGLVLPISIILATECIISNRRGTAHISEYKFGDWNVPEWVFQGYKQIGVFGFGAAVSQLITDIAKYSIGRLRPHFISVCNPIMPDGSSCSDPQNFGKYIEEFTCNSDDSTERMLKEMRLSFPSGHSSFSAFTMAYCMFYLQSRMDWHGSKLAKHLLQFLLFTLAWFTALSRVSDYKHHWSDALAGSLLGTVSAFVVIYWISDLFNKRKNILPANHNDITTRNGRV